MRNIMLTAVTASLVAAGAAYAHAPAGDPHFSCLSMIGNGVVGPAPVNITGTLTYLAPLGTSMPQCNAPPPSPPLTPGLPAYSAEWGSHAPACGGIGPIAGAYCGPIVPAGGTATCTFNPVNNTVPTRLTIAFEQNGNGLVRYPGDGDYYVAGPFGPGSWLVMNYYPWPARVIGFPTHVGGGMMAPNDLNQVICVTP